MVYRTTKVVTWSKPELAERSVALFGQQRKDDRLVLITCTGWTGQRVHEQRRGVRRPARRAGRQEEDLLRAALPVTRLLRPSYSTQ